MYMVSVQLGKAPSRVHNTLDEAQAEAQRLAKKHPGLIATVLKIECEYKAETVVLPFERKQGSEDVYKEEDNIF